MLPLAVFTSAKKPKIAPSYAWSITEPLGEHYPSTIDTLQYNYQRQAVRTTSAGASPFSRAA